MFLLLGLVASPVVFLVLCRVAGTACDGEFVVVVVEVLSLGRLSPMIVLVGEDSSPLDVVTHMIK